MHTLTLKETLEVLYIISPACLDDEQELGHRFLVEVSNGEETLLIDLTVSHPASSVISRAIKDELGTEYYVNQVWRPVA